MPVRKTMAPSKHTSAAASKIKQKLLNTSSFFKVSLKTNNKALALALEAQKERSRQLEMEVVYLQKQVEALCFELATKKYKHRKLLLILKDFHNNTLQHLGTVTDLFSDSDLPKLSYEHNTLPGDNGEGAPPVEGLTDKIPHPPKMPGGLVSSLQKVTADCPEKSNCVNILSIPNSPLKLQNSTGTCSDAEARRSSQHVQSFPTGTSRPSSSLAHEVERLSMKFSQSGFDMNSLRCPQNSQPPSVVSTCEKPQPSIPDNAHFPSNSVTEHEPENGIRQERTVLLNTAMEMTLSDSSEIVFVEPKAKRKKPVGRPKKKKTEGQVCGSDKTENTQMKNSAGHGLTEVQIVPIGALLQTDGQALGDIRDPKIFELQPPRTECMSTIPSYIPKLSKSVSGSQHKTATDKFKSSDHTTSKPESNDVVPQQLDDYFMDPGIKDPKPSKSITSQSEKETAEEPRPKITCRRPRNKGRRVSSVLRRTFTLPLHDSESSQSTLGEVHNDMEEHVGNEPQSKMATAINSVGSHKSVCRTTFFVSVASEDVSSNRASSRMDALEPDFMPSTGSSICEAEDPSTLIRSSGISPFSRDKPQVMEAQNSCKQGRQDDLSHGVVLLDQGCASRTESQNLKKARREKTSSASKRKAIQTEDCVDHFNDRKNEKKSSYTNKGFRSEDEACYLVDCIDGPELEQIDGLQVADPQCRKTFKLHTPTETRNPLETLVVYGRKTQGSSSRNNTKTNRQASHCHRRDTSNEAPHQNLGDLLTNEIPPWLDLENANIADSEEDSLLATPKRATSGRGAVIEESSTVTTEASTVGLLKSQNDAVAVPGRRTRKKTTVSYKEPTINSKMRRGDKFTDSMFLSSPVFKDGKKKKRQKKTLPNTQIEKLFPLD